MPNVLISGPAGGGKSQTARDLLREATEPTVQADFQSIVVALLALVRLPDGRYPVRPDFVLPLAEYVRQAVITGATQRGLSVVATNSDGDPARRRALLDRLGPGATERIVDLGEVPELDPQRTPDRPPPDPPRTTDDPPQPPARRRSRGEELARARLADPVTGVLSDECEKAIARWFGRVNRG